MKRNLQNAKFIVEIESIKGEKKITLISLFDTRTQEKKNADFIKNRGVEWFLDIEDMKETLNWNLCGDSDKYFFKWVNSGKNRSVGYAYIFD